MKDYNQKLEEIKNTKENNKMRNIELYNKIESLSPKSAWRKGVQQQALEMVEQSEVKLTKDNAKEVLLNGAETWSEYSYSGNALIYDADIAERYCTPSELRRNNHGNKKPNANEEWMDLQARALSQAYLLVKRSIR